MATMVKTSKPSKGAGVCSNRRVFLYHLTVRQWHFANEKLEEYYLEDPMQTLFDNLHGYWLTASYHGNYVTIHPHVGKSQISKQVSWLANVTYRMDSGHLHPIAYGPVYLQEANFPIERLLGIKDYRLEPVIYGTQLWCWYAEECWHISTRRNPDGRWSMINKSPLMETLTDMITDYADPDPFSDSPRNPFFYLNQHFCYGLVISTPLFNPTGKVRPKMLLHISTRDSKGADVPDEPFRVSLKDNVPRIPEIKFNIEPEDEDKEENFLLSKLIPHYDSFTALVEGYHNCSKDAEIPMLGLICRRRYPSAEKYDLIFKSKVYREFEMEGVAFSCECHEEGKSEQGKDLQGPKVLWADKLEEEFKPPKEKPKIEVKSIMKRTK